MPSTELRGRVFTLPAVAALVAAALAPGGASAATDFPDGYAAHHTYAEVAGALRTLARNHPDIVRLSSIGVSHEGRRLFLVKISDRVTVDEAEPEVYVDGGIHGHEHASTEQALALIGWLVRSYGTDARVTAIVNTTEIWIAPLANPDGATFDIAAGDRFARWRKNRKPNADGSIGTDVNRNFANHWGGPGSSATPSHDFYRGTTPWSTREARHVRDFVASREVGGRQQLRLALTIHSHGEFIMFPFGWTRDPLPSGMTAADRAVFAGLADGIATRNGYRAMQAGSLYRSSGTFMDWAFARQGIFALTLELGPPSGVANGWYLRDGQLATELARNRDALLWFVEQAQTR